MDLGEDEQVQSQPSGDTEILEEQLHTEEYIQCQQHEEKEEQGFVASQSLAEIAADDQVENGIKMQEEVAPQEPTSSHPAAKVDKGKPQKEDVVTQEPTSLEGVEVVAKGIPGGVVVTQEPTPPKVTSDVQNV